MSLLHIVQTGSEAHRASYPIGTGALSPGINRQGREAGSLSTSSAEVENGGVIPPLQHPSLWRGAQELHRYPYS